MVKVRTGLYLDDDNEAMAKKVIAGELLEKKIKKTEKGLASPGYIMTIWDRERGEIFEIPKGISREDLEYFFQSLAERILK